MHRFLPIRCLVLASLVTGLAAADTAVTVLMPKPSLVEQHQRSGPFAPALEQAGVADAAGAADRSTWQRVASAASQLRFELQIGPDRGSLPGLIGVLAALAPSVPVPLLHPGVHPMRSDAWVLAGVGTAVLPVPAAPVLPETVGDPLLAAISIQLRPWRRLLDPSTTRQVIMDATDRLGGGRIEASVQAGADGQHESGRWSEFALPLRPVDRLALAGLPSVPVAILACGIDGEALAKLMDEVMRRDGDCVEAFQRAFQRPVAECGPLWNGTICIAVTAVSPQLTWVASLPRSTMLDELVKAHVLAQAEVGGDELVAALELQPVRVVWPGLGGVLMQRGQTRWCFGNDAVAITAAASSEGIPFPIEAVVPAFKDTDALLAYGDLSVLGPAYATLLPAGVQAMVSRGAGQLPRAYLSAAKDGADLTFAGRNVFGLSAPILAMLPGYAGRLATSYEDACQQATQANFTRILNRGFAFSAATSGHWPRDLDDLKAWAKDIPGDAYEQAGRADLLEPFCYVQPRGGAPADQPIIVQDPAINRGAGSLVGFAGGEVRFIPGDLYWREAKRLVALPDTRANGVDPTQWATMPRTF